MYVSNVIDQMYSNFFQSCTTEPNRIVSKNKPYLFDNIFIKYCTKQLKAGNLVDKMSDPIS